MSCFFICGRSSINHIEVYNNQNNDKIDPRLRYLKLPEKTVTVTSGDETNTIQITRSAPSVFTKIAGPVRLDTPTETESSEEHNGSSKTDSIIPEILYNKSAHLAQLQTTIRRIEALKPKPLETLNTKPIKKSPTTLALPTEKKLTYIDPKTPFHEHKNPPKYGEKFGQYGYFKEQKA